MAKTILGEQNKREAAFWEYVNSKIGRGRRYKTDGEFAEKALGFSARGFSKWRTGGLPDHFETLCQMFLRTHITDRQLCRIFGVEYKGRTKDDCRDGETAETSPAA